MGKRVGIAVLWGVVFLVLLPGCVTAPGYFVEGPGSEQRIESHTRFLAQPALNGRKPRSVGAVRARRYIARHFTEAGLAPWGDAAGFGQSVGFGQNLVGVLPGADPQLSNEVILISAHYDHLGGGKLGAADNASGVAALLELVQRFAQSPERPKRTLCFAAFDCEEKGLWGSVAFTCRDDFDPKRVAAVVNMDLLGRAGFDCMEKTLFMGRTHVSPPVGDASALAAQQAGLQLLPFHALLVGPSSDHASFTSLGIPAFLFSTGLYTG